MPHNVFESLGMMMFAFAVGVWCMPPPWYRARRWIFVLAALPPAWFLSLLAHFATDGNPQIQVGIVSAACIVGLLAVAIFFQAFRPATTTTCTTSTPSTLFRAWQILWRIVILAIALLITFGALGGMLALAVGQESGGIFRLLALACTVGIMVLWARRNPKCVVNEA